MITLNKDFKDISHKVTKVGGLNKAKKAVKFQAQKDFIESDLGRKIDRANAQRESRRAQRESRRAQRNK